MSEQNSNNSKNEKLALQIGRLLDRGQSPNDADDPLMGELARYRNDKWQQIEQKVDAVDSNQLWNRIDRQTELKESSKDSASIFTLTSSFTRWAAAAVLILAAFISYFYVSDYLQPSPIAESASQIETVQLRGGSEVKLRPHSKLYKLAVNAEERSYRLAGEALFQVSKQAGRPFSVRAGNGKVTVTGTRFNLSSWGKVVRLYVAEGSVKFAKNGTRDSLMVHRGQAATLQGKNNKPQKIKADEAVFTDWLNQQAIFDNEKVKFVFAELEQQFNISIKAPDRIRNEQLTGRVSLENLDVALHDLERALGGQFRKTGKHSYRFTTK